MEYTKELHERLQNSNRGCVCCWKAETDALLAEITRLQSLTRWVSTNEKLPDKEGLYCVTGKYLNGDIKVFSCYFKGNSYRKFGDRSIWETSVNQITHWMTLPLPPEGVK